MLGNRGGRFHRDDKALGKRRWASHHWIACELHYKDWHHEPMGQGYTSLFFLDEVTALAAGHRPCFLCRRLEAKAFLGNSRVDIFDRQLHAERLQVKRQDVHPASAADGTMFESEGAFFALRCHKLLRWSFEGYTASIPVNPTMRAKLLTPPSITAILATGYEPRWHETALQWDGTS